VNAPGLTQMFVNLAETFPLIVNLVFLLMALFGLFVGFRGVQSLYVLAAQDYRFTNHPPSFESAFAQMALGGALAVAPGLLWRAANTFVLGGDATTAIFNYGSVPKSGNCDAIRIALSYFFMAIGAVAWFCAGLQLYDGTRGHRHRGGSAALYLIGGVLCFFINDAATIIGDSLGMSVSLENVCKSLGSGG
jgi:hypothetical protein